MLPAITRNAGSAAMIISLAEGIRKVRGINDFLKAIVAVALEKLDLPPLENTPRARWQDTGQMAASKTFVDPIKTLLYCRRLGFLPELAQYATRISGEASDGPLQRFKSTYLPFLQELAPRLKSNDATTLPPFQTMYRNILNAYVSKAAVPMPIAPQDWSRRTSGCRCNDCTTVLNPFLRHPDQIIGNFLRQDKERKHFEQQIALCCSRGDIAFSKIKEQCHIVGIRLKKTIQVHDLAMKKWHSQRSDIRNSISGLYNKDNGLKSLLGKHYNPILELKPIPQQPLLKPESITT